jgi:hypothetical protein
VAAAFAGAAWLAWASDPDDKIGGLIGELGDFRTEATGIAFAVVFIEEMARWRAYLDRKREIIQQMASLSNDFALDAAHIAENEKWLFDGSLQGADLSRADLRGAHLNWAKLQGARLEGANLRGARLAEADLQEARYDFATKWPDGFNQIAAGAVLIDEEEPPST